LHVHTIFVLSKLFKLGAMKLEVLRTDYHEDRVLGRLLIDGVFFCHTLEDKRRWDGSKVFGRTCIPSGTYNVVLTMSKRFGRLLPLLENVPNFDAIRIHRGNTDKDTHGCVLVGMDVAPDQSAILNSRVAEEALMAKLEVAYKAKEPITIKVTDTN